MTGNRIDTDALLERVDLAAVVSAYVKLKRAGREYQGLCPFHHERSPSFTVNPLKRFVHCFGCGEHHNAIGFVMAMTGKPFREACEQLNGGALSVANVVRRAPPPPAVMERLWLPLLPAPEWAEPVLDGRGWARLWNPKRGRFWNCQPSRCDAYLSADGEVLGYVLRVEMPDGRKITPQVTHCVDPDGVAAWCVRPFPTPRPLCGLDELALQVAAIASATATRKRLVRAGESPELQEGEQLEQLSWRPALVVEGEKCRAAGAGALPQYAAVTWPGGSKGIHHADWSPLRDRDIVLWPDADPAGRAAMLGWEDSSGRLHDGVAQLAWRAGARSLRMVDTTGQPQGWDIADALQIDGWTPKQLAVWAAQRVVDIQVRHEPARRVA